MTDANFYVDTNNVIRWTSSDNVPFDDKLTEFLINDLATSEQVANSITVRKAEEVDAVNRYIANRKKVGYSDEEKFELKAAFGDEEVINIFNGLSIYK